VVNSPYRSANDCYNLPMRVFISVDMEGITGLVSWSQCSRPNGKFYDYGYARQMMTHDVNAAIRGARKAGATEIVVKDSHGNSKNLLIADLEPGVELISGEGRPGDGMMWGIGETQDGKPFDAAMLVGYHAKAGTLKGIMEHTITGGVHRMFLESGSSRIEMGEIGVAMLTAGAYGIPIVMISSDDLGCAEAKEHAPTIVTAETKTGLARYMGKLKHPSVTGPLIEEAAYQALQTKHTPFHVELPARVSLEFNRAEMAEMCMWLQGAERVDAYTVAGTFSDFHSLHKFCWACWMLSFKGVDTQD